MRSSVVWSVQSVDKEQTPLPVYDVSFHPGGGYLAVSAGARVAIYDAHSSALLQLLKGHSSTVYCVSYSEDGQRLASGGRDKCVIIWASRASHAANSTTRDRSSPTPLSSPQMEGILRYTHKESVRCLSYSPAVGWSLLSCSGVDFGVWSHGQANVTKYTVPSRVNACCWSSDGSLLVLALDNGVVSVRCKNGSEKARVDRGGAAVWGVCLWRRPSEAPLSPSSQLQQQRARAVPAAAADCELLVVADWSPALTLYSLNTTDFTVTELCGERRLDEDACAVCVLPVSSPSSSPSSSSPSSWLVAHGCCVAVGGSDGCLSLYSPDGAVNVGSVTSPAERTEEPGSEWLWSCAVQPHSDCCMVCGSEDGTITLHQLSFGTVHALYRQHYALRENMTEVLVRHLSTDHKVRINCHSLVKRLALHNSLLAVQLTERIMVYELYVGSSTDLHQRVKARLDGVFECSQLVMCARLLILCRDNCLQSVDFDGVRQRQWRFDTTVRFVRVMGGPADRETLLVGLNDGQIYKVHVDNAFPVSLARVASAVRCADVSALGTRLAVVDDNCTLQVFSLLDKQLIHQEPNAVSVAFNTYLDNLLCFTGDDNMLRVQADSMPVLQQPAEGNVLGFSGAHVQLLSGSRLYTTTALLSAAMYQYMERGLYLEAYQVACVGVSQADWRVLAAAALDALQLSVARSAFNRLRDTPALQLLVSLTNGARDGSGDNLLLLADIAAYRGHFSEATSLYRRAGSVARALQMYTDLCMFDAAQELVDSGVAGDSVAAAAASQQLLERRAAWPQSDADLRTTARLLLRAGHTRRALQLICQHDWTDMLMETGRTLDKADVQHVELVAVSLKQQHHYTLAAEMYRKVSNHTAELECFIAAELWDEAFSLAAQHPLLQQAVYLPYARHLAENDRFLDAQKAFHKAGREDLSFSILEQLTDNAIDECRFSDAGFYHWLLSQQCVMSAAQTGDDDGRLAGLFEQHQRCADVYHAYHALHRYIEQPFTEHGAQAIFNISRFVWHRLTEQHVRGVSQFYTLYALAKQARVLEAFKVARFALNKIQQLVVPARYQESVDLMSVQLRAGRAYTDRAELLPLCYRCSSVNPPLNPAGSRCVNCQQPFVYSFYSLEELALVEFHVEPDISDEEALRLIEQSPDSDQPVQDDSHGSSTTWKETRGDSCQTLTLESQHVDLFAQQASALEGEDAVRGPAVAGREALRSLAPTDVLVLRWPAPLRAQFFNNLMPDVPVSHCRSCNRVYHTEDFELQCLQNKCCPFCRQPTELCSQE